METKKTITGFQYWLGILDTIDFIQSEMCVFLEEEGRYHGIVKSYMNNIRDAFKTFNSDPKVLENIDEMGRVLYVIRIQIYKDFKRLAEKKLSCADRCTIISLKLLEIAEKVGISGDMFVKESKTIKKVLGKLWGNIKNRGKYDPLYQLGDLLGNAIQTGRSGKYSNDILDLVGQEHPKPKKLELRGERVVAKGETGVQITKEVDL